MYAEWGSRKRFLRGLRLLDWSVEALGSRWASRSSKPFAGRATPVLGGFDSHAPPLAAGGKALYACRAPVNLAPG